MISDYNEIFFYKFEKNKKCRLNLPLVSFKKFSIIL